MKAYTMVALVSALLGMTAARADSTTGLDSANPFASPSRLPYQAPAFDKIRDADFLPAIDAGMRQELADVEAIANDPDAPTFANTIEAMERKGALLRRVLPVFYGLVSSNKNAALQGVQTQVAPRLAAHQDAIYLKAGLFARVKKVFDARKKLDLDAEAVYLVERYYRDFVRAGAQLSDADKIRLRALNAEESKLTDEYSNKVLADANASALVLNDKSELAGLSAADIAAAAETAAASGHAGKWAIALQNTTQQPSLAYLSNRAVRAKLFAASEKRGSHGNENDTRKIIVRLVQLRAQRARLLGFENYASYALDDQMAKAPDQVTHLLATLATGAVAKANDEAGWIQREIDRQGGGFELEPWDWKHYSEQVRKAKFDLDESQVRPYFELERVLQDGVFYSANELYGLSFKERKDIPVYQPDVRVFEVFDADGSALALFYADLFSRPNKNGGAWTSGFVDPNRLLGDRPVVTNVENLARPATGQPKLLSFDEVTTLFHEFGHALQRFASQARYPTSNMPRDFVEVPSMFNEHWALYPAVFAHYARHYRTAEPMPRELVEKIAKSRTFNQGYATTELVASALLDMAWHSLPDSAPPQDADAFELDALRRYRVFVREVPPRYRSAYFSHIWSGGYAAGYYAYLWSEVIEDDAFAWFREHGGLTRENGQRFREMILAHAGTQDAAAMYRLFRGRDAVLGPLLEQRGLKGPMAATWLR